MILGSVRPNRGPNFLKGLNREITRIAPRIRGVTVDLGLHQGLTNSAINTNISGRSIKMLSVRGVYENGAVKFKEKVSITGETPVIVTFLEDLEGKETKRIKNQPGDIFEKVMRLSWNMGKKLYHDRDSLYER
jgi:predicted DNA-binding antitoxin AbrB/MazE fold protein